MKQIGRRRKARRGLASTLHTRVFLALACGAEHTTREREGREREGKREKERGEREKERGGKEGRRGGGGRGGGGGGGGKEGGGGGTGGKGEEEGGGEEFGLQWAKARKKGLLVIIKSSHTDFLPNLFPRGP